MLGKKRKEGKTNNAFFNYYNAKRQNLIDLADAHKNLYGSQHKKKKKI